MEDHSHHLVMGELRDFLSGRRIPDTHDERYRQKLARHLVETLGYKKEEIEQNTPLVIRAGGKEATIHLDFLVTLEKRAVMMIKYAPGSLVTRRMSNLALSRLVKPYQIPVVVTANGEDAEIISGFTGKVTGQGIDGIPHRDASAFSEAAGKACSIDPALFDKASRIAYACVVEGSCLMDNDFKCDSWYCYPK